MVSGFSETFGHKTDKRGENRNYGMDTESLKFIFISKRVVSLYEGLNQVDI